MSDRPVIIIRKKKKGGDHGHHGGAWKVAYADFVTAMMAFFLLLWLLNVTTDVQRRGIADYFAPASISKSSSGAGGVFGGESITSTEGAQISQYTPPHDDEVTIPTAGQGEQGEVDTKGKSENNDAGKTDDTGKGAGKSADAKNAAGGTTTGDGGAPGSSKTLNKEDQQMADAMKQEEQAFKQAEELIKQAIVGNAEFREFANQIVVDRTPEGLRIQIVDRDKFSMFPSGSANPYERARDLLRMVGKVVGRLPNEISVTGHTDGTPFVMGSPRDNWTLSTERANKSRQELIVGGVAESRIQRVVGLADRDLYVPKDPKDPRNRRISIVLLRKSIPPADFGNAPLPAPAPPAPTAIPTQVQP